MFCSGYGETQRQMRVADTRWAELGEAQGDQ
jgi:hypothetical protein